MKALYELLPHILNWLLKRAIDCGTGIYRRYFNNVIIRFWGKKPTRKSLIFPVYRDAKGKNLPEKYARIEDALAIYEITSSVRRLGLECQVYNHDQEIPTDSDLILICSPKANHRSKKFYEENKEGLPFRLEDKNNTFVIHLYDDNTGAGLPFFSPADQLQIEDPTVNEAPTHARSASTASNQQQINKQDIAIICRWTDHARRRVFLLWGVHGIGTLAAARYLTSRKSLEDLVQSTNDRDFCVVIKAPFTDIWHIGKAKICSSIYFRPETSLDNN